MTSDNVKFLNFYAVTVFDQDLALLEGSIEFELLLKVLSSHKREGSSVVSIEPS